MVCTRRGCGVSWEKHQLHPAECRGSTRPPRGSYIPPDADPALRCWVVHEMHYLGYEGLTEIAKKLSKSRSTIERDIEQQAAKPNEAAQSYPGLA